MREGIRVCSLLLCAACGYTVLCSTVAAETAFDYRVEPLRDINEPIQIKAFNDLGMIAAQRPISPSGEHRSRVFYSNGAFRDFDGRVTALNDLGDILVDTSDTQNDIWSSELYRLGETIHLSFRGAAINNDCAVGYAQPPGTGEGDTIAYMYVFDTNETTEIGNFEPACINNKNVIAGVQKEGNWTRDPIIWKDGQVRRLEVYSFWTQYGWHEVHYFRVTGINDAGMVIGVSDAGDTGRQRLCLWDTDLKIHFLFEGLTNRGDAYDINNRGQIVGQLPHLAAHELVGYIQGDNTWSTSFLWQDGKAVALNGFLTHESDCLGIGHRPRINESGQIVATGPLKDGSTAIVLATPVKQALRSGDLNGDRKVDFADLCHIVGHWLEYYPRMWENQPPDISFITPTPDQVFTDRFVEVRVAPTDPDGRIHKVEFFATDPENSELRIKIGEDTDPADGWGFDWFASGRMGPCTVYAIAFDDWLSTAEESVNIALPDSQDR